MKVNVDLIQQVQEHFKMTRTGIASVVGVSTSTFWAWLKAKSNPHPNQYSKFYAFCCENTMQLEAHYPKGLPVWKDDGPLYHPFCEDINMCNVTFHNYPALVYRRSFGNRSELIRAIGEHRLQHLIANPEKATMLDLGKFYRFAQGKGFGDLVWHHYLRD